MVHIREQRIPATRHGAPSMLPADDEAAGRGPNRIGGTVACAPAGYELFDLPDVD
jgi:hypothetical protein